MLLSCLLCYCHARCADAMAPMHSQAFNPLCFTFLPILQGKFFEAKCTDIMPEEKTIVACFPGGSRLKQSACALEHLVLRWAGHVRAAR